MNLPKIALFVLLAACAQPAYSGSASAGEASSAPVALPAAPVATPAPAAPSAGIARPVKRPATPAPVPRSGPSSRTAPVLVIPAKEMDTATYSRIVEDLSVMSRIIEKNVAGAPELMPYRLEEMYAPSLLKLAGPDHSTLPVLRSSGGRPKSVYVGGYGVLFCLEVKFPLVPPPEMPKPDQNTEKTDQVWAAAQRELADPQGARRGRRAGTEGETCKAEAVEGLKNALIATLKHVANIRDLEPESWLTILVQGPSTIQEPPADPSDSQPMPLIGGAHAAGRTLLTLRVKKADVDQFAKGQLDDTQFQQRVQIVTR